jgi:hypothetical protein
VTPRQAPHRTWEDSSCSLTWCGRVFRHQQFFGMHLISGRAKRDAPSGAWEAATGRSSLRRWPWNWKDSVPTMLYTRRILYDICTTTHGSHSLHRLHAAPS